jgi:hypothetical protein
LETHKRHLVV